MTMKSESTKPLQCSNRWKSLDGAVRQDGLNITGRKLHWPKSLTMTMQPNHLLDAVPGCGLKGACTGFAQNVVQTLGPSSSWNIGHSTLSILNHSRTWESMRIHSLSEAPQAICRGSLKSGATLTLRQNCRMPIIQEKAVFVHPCRVGLREAGQSQKVSRNWNRAMSNHLLHHCLRAPCLEIAQRRFPSHLGMPCLPQLIPCLSQQATTTGPQVDSLETLHCIRLHWYDWVLMRQVVQRPR